MNGKWVTIGIILLCIGASVVPNISGSNDKKRIDGRSSNTQTTIDETITDWTEDVCSFDFYRNTWAIITNSKDIAVDNIDLVQTSFTQQDSQVTLNLQVAGRIEDRGHLGNFTNETDQVEYYFSLITSGRNYFIVYVNQTGVIIYDNVTVNLTSSDFTVLNDTLSITFSLMNLTEKYVRLKGSALYVKANISSPPSTFVWLQDTVPNEWTKVILFGTYNNSDFRGAYMQLETVRLWMIRFDPFQVTCFKPGDIIRVSTPYLARLITNHFIIGMVDVLEF